MKRLFVLLSFLFCGFAFADTETINWYVDGNVYATNTCTTGGDIILPTTPTKYGYTFQGWANYTPIEYLESTRTQYIDTGYYIDISNIRIETKAVKDYPYSLFGAGDNVISYVYSGSNIGSYMYYGTNTQWYATWKPQDPSKAYTFYFDKGNVYVDNELKGSETSQTGVITKALILFARNIRTGINDNGSHKIYYFKIWAGDVLVRDFIPVLDENGTPCMLDKVEKKFYYNAGTGQFIAGPVINQ